MGQDTSQQFIARRAELQKIFQSVNLGKTFEVMFDLVDKNLTPKLAQTDLEIKNLKSEISDLKLLGGAFAVCTIAGLIYLSTTRCKCHKEK